jgi:hypothetical protein
MFGRRIASFNRQSTGQPIDRSWTDRRKTTDRDSPQATPKP